MKKGICEVCYARLCPTCAEDMKPAYFVNYLGKERRGSCERCGRPAWTSLYRYLMTGAEMKRRGLELI